MTGQNILKLLIGSTSLLAGCFDQALDLPVDSGITSEWPYYAAAPGAGRYSAADQIRPDNVNRLSVAWTHRSGDFFTGRSVADGSASDTSEPFSTSLEVTPIVADGRLYYCTPFNRVFALDPETGEEQWVFDPVVDHAQDAQRHCRGVSYWRDVKADPDQACSSRIFLGTLDSRLISIDAATGKRCIGFGRNGEVDLKDQLSKFDFVEHGVTSPPAILNDLVITGAFVLDGVRMDPPAGVVRAFDARSGEQRWGWNAVPKGVSATDENGDYRPGTANVWSIITVDPQRNLVFVPTGNAAPDFFGVRRQDYDDYSSSIVALNGESGEVVWRFQTVHHDLWDYDVAAPPTLVDLQIEDQMVPALVQVTKMGLTFVLNRETGEPLFDIIEKAVPTTGKLTEETLSPTQPFPATFASLHRLGVTPDDAWGFTFYDKGACRTRIEALNHGPIYTPPSLKGTISSPGLTGGNNWGSPAIDPKRKILITATQHIPYIVTLVPREKCDAMSVSTQPQKGASRSIQPQSGAPYCVEFELLMSPFGVPCTPPPWGTLDATDLTTGRLLWQVPLGSTKGIAPWPLWKNFGVPPVGGPMVTATGLVFVGATSDKKLRAFDVSNGEELWKTELPAAAHAVPMSYRLRPDGRQFIVIAAGGHFSNLTPQADYLIAFALPVP